MWLAQVGSLTQMVAPGAARLSSSAPTRRAPQPPGVNTVATRPLASAGWSAPKVSFAISTLNSGTPAGPM
jgi:hypothetical protein